MVQTKNIVYMSDFRILKIDFDLHKMCKYIWSHIAPNDKIQVQNTLKALANGVPSQTPVEKHFTVFILFILFLRHKNNIQFP